MNGALAHEGDGRRSQATPERRLKPEGLRLRTALRRFDLGRKAVLDVGCGDGVYLNAFGPRSVGLDVQDGVVARARLMGLDVRACNLESDEYPLGSQQFDAIWLSNYLEHSLAPHALLIRLRRYLRDEGTLLVTIPVVPPTGPRRVVLESFGPWKGIYAADHVNFFTVHTARQTIQRAGYEIEDVFAPSVPFLALGRMLRAVWPTAMFAARKIPAWSYPAKAHKHLVNGRIVARE